MTADLLNRKATHFAFWAPRATRSAPTLIIGQFQPGNPPVLTNEQQFDLAPAAGASGLWEIPAASCNLQNGQIYHYWFEVDDTNPDRELLQRFRCTDPTAFTVDWRLVAPRPPGPYTEDDRQPASVAEFDNGRLVPCDPDGELPSMAGEPDLDALPPNNQLVIYELPTAWTRITETSSLERAVGTFRDVTALIDADAEGFNFSDLDVVQPGRSYLTELGVNALELLPPADSAYRREWGYGTSHFFAPDFELGFPETHSSPTANTDLAALVVACHQHGIRFFVDVVMAFARKGPYEAIDFPDFHIASPAEHTNDPDALTSTRGFGVKEVRNGFGSTLFRYAKFVNTYDPISGQNADISPARQFMHAYVTRWMQDFHIDGIRMDSVENVYNWDFIGDFKDRARRLWNDRWNSQALGTGSDARFLVVGEELSMPLDLLKQQRLDGLWNDQFRALARASLIGQTAGGDNFEWTVRKAIDCRNLGFSDGAQAINYLTSHDVEGFRRERLFNFFRNSGVGDIEKRIKLGFVCLLTAVGIPMILAGEEFADQHDLFDENGNVTQQGGKQVDPVNYSRLRDPMRQRIFEYVVRLVKLRTAHPALAVNDTEFIHVDFTAGKRVLVWRRGASGSDNPVVVIANFSDFVTENPVSPTAEYVVANWPATPPGRQWREVTQDRLVPPAFAGREPIYAWEAKVYVLE